MEIRAITAEDNLWERTADYAAGCSWRVGGALAQAMRGGAFHGWERVFVAVEDGCLAGFCTLAARDCIPDVDYTPYIGMVFVGEEHRGRRLSQRLVDAAADRARALGFGRVYLVSDHEGLYEKYGFIPVEQHPAPWDPAAMETIFTREL